MKRARSKRIGGRWVLETDEQDGDFIYCQSDGDFDERMSIYLPGDPQQRKRAIRAILGVLRQKVPKPTNSEALKWQTTMRSIADLALAGLITSGTRAALYHIALRDMPSVISFNTDALFTTNENLVSSAELMAAIARRDLLIKKL